MTADVYPFDSAFLSRVATRIVNEVAGHQPVGLRLCEQAAGDDRVAVGAPRPESLSRDRYDLSAASLPAPRPRRRPAAMMK